MQSMPPPTDRQLRAFGGSLGLMLVLVAAIVQWKFQLASVSITLLTFAVVLTAVYYAFPRSRRRVYDGFRTLTYPIHVVAMTILLSLVYYLVLTPIGLLFQLAGKDIRSRARRRDTHWAKRESDRDIGRYFDTY